MRLRRRDVGTVVGSSCVHRRLITRGDVRLVDGCSLANVAWNLVARLGRVTGMGRGVSRRRTTSEGGKTTLTLLDLALNATAVWSLANRWQDGTHNLDEMDTQSRRSKLERSLNDVVAVRVAHERLEFFNVKKLLNQELLGGHLGAADAFLNDVGAKLLLGKLNDFALEAFTHRRSELGVVQVEDVLYDVVTKGILDEMEAVRSDLADEVDLLVARSMVDAALKNAAAVAVRADSDTMFTHCVEDELGLGRLEVIQAFLDNVVAVQILNQVDNLARQGLDDHLSL
jgi:hypothetical protein